jgi:hypothetical protein
MVELLHDFKFEDRAAAVLVMPMTRRLQQSMRGMCFSRGAALNQTLIDA